MPSSDANPYLALAASLGCGLLGIKNRLDPTPPTEDAANEGEIDLPRDLLKAVSLLEDEPAWPVFLREVTAFLAQDRGQTSAAGPDDTLSAREREVLDLAARGLDNRSIAGLLVLSVRTVERHLQNVYLKLGVGGPNARTAAVTRWLGRQ